jgi:hypothetical protein
MQKKYSSDYTVIIHVVQVVIEVDSSGKQDERYAMSKMMANDGKSQTKTCHSECFHQGRTEEPSHAKCDESRLTMISYSDCG